MLASSSQRESKPEKSRQAKKVGCMSGIFYFLHLHRHQSRKRLPSGKRDNKTTVSPTPPPQPAPEPPAAAEAGEKTPHNKRVERREVAAPAAVEPGEKTPHNKRAAPHVVAVPAEPGEKTPHNKRAAPHVAAAPAEPGEKIPHNKRAAQPVAAPPTPAVAASPASQSRRLSCDTPRSPTLPSEIRRSNSAGSTPRKSPALVARLMGLDDPPPCDTPESAAEKRRKLLGALERCDEDLKALKKIIEALHVSESRRAVTAGLADSGGPATPRVEEKRCLELDGEQPSPVSVLDALSSPPARRRCTASATPRGNQRGPAAPAVQSKQQPHVAAAPPLRPGCDDKDGRVVDAAQNPVFHRNADIGAPSRRATRLFMELGPMQKGTTTSLPWRQQPCSRAMEESVDQVWEDGVWEERWELGRVGVVLEGDILGDLVVEVVKELGFHSCRLALPFDACRKRLCF